MDLLDFRDAFKYYTIVYLKKDFKNSFMEKRNAVNKKTYRFNFTITDEDLVSKIPKTPPPPPKAKIGTADDAIAVKKKPAAEEPPAKKEEPVAKKEEAPKKAPPAKKAINLEADDVEDNEPQGELQGEQTPDDEQNLLLESMLMLEDDGEGEEEDEDDEM